MNAIDPFHFRQVMGQYPTGVTVITAMGPDSEPLGMVVGTFSSVSLDPPLVCFMPGREAGAWKAIRESGTRFCVNVLSESQIEVGQSIATRWTNRFEGIPYSLSPGGQPVIHGAVAYIDCTLENVVEAGDHDIVLGRVESLNVLSTAYPLLFFRGGYGAFHAQTLTSRDAAIREDVKLITPCRGVMEELASRMSSEVTALLVEGDDIVLAASAGRSEAATVPNRVGQRLPFSPPIGSLHAAFGGQDLEDKWLQAGGEAEIAANSAILAEVRRRGYSVAYGHRNHEVVEQVTAKLGRRDKTVTDDDLRTALHDFA